MGFRDNASPWSFFIPVTLAVVVGLLVTDVIRFAIGAAFDGDDGATPAVAAQEAAASEGMDEGAEPVVAPAAPAPVEVAVKADLPPAQAGPADSEPRNADGVLELPNPLAARRDGDPAACVNGTVAYRVAGGWEQALENDAPVRCVTVNP